MKIIIYAMGKIFQKIKSKINWNDVIAIVDSKANDGDMFNSIPIFRPDKIIDLEFDFIVICSSDYFRSIRRNLISDFFVPEDKIVSFMIFEKNEKFSTEVNEVISTFINNHDIKKIADLGLNLENNQKETLLNWKNNNVTIDGVGKLTNPLNRRIYYEYNNIVCASKYDCIIMNRENADKYEELLKNINSDYLICYSNYDWNLERKSKPIAFSMGLSSLQRIAMLTGVIDIYGRNEERESLECEIYVVSHKKCNLLSTGLYKPICVGQKPWTDRYLSECRGENIAEYNNRLNECTALYWIWKNASSKYVGLSHYRRYFYNDSVEYSANYLNMQKIYQIFEVKKFDIILPNLLTLNFSVSDNIKRTVGEEIYNKAYDNIIELMNKYQPMYVGNLNNVLEGNQMYICNMFVTSKAIADRYCEWLFSFIVEAAENFKIEGFTDLQKRTIGYFAEIMMTCWIQKENLKIYELPVTNVWLK